MEYIKKESKKLRNIWWRFILFATGGFLIFQHYSDWGRLDFWDILGHEWLGIILVIIPIITMFKFKWTQDISPIQYAKKKIKYIFGVK